MDKQTESTSIAPSSSELTTTETMKASELEQLDVEQLYRSLHCDSDTISPKTEQLFIETGNKDTYGELTRKGLAKLLADLPTDEKVYYDLGSGLGKTLIYAVLDHGFKKAVGIELAKERVEKAKKVVSHFPVDVQERMINQAMSFLDPSLDLSDADVMFVSSLDFTKTILAELAEKLDRELKSGTRVFSSRILRAPRLKSVKLWQVSMTWSLASSVYEYIVE